MTAHPNYSHLCTAVGQYLAFSLMALGLPGEGRLHRQHEHRQATEKLKMWIEDFETTLQSISEDERCTPQSSSSYQPEVYKDVDRSPYYLKGKRERYINEQAQRDPGDSSNDKSAPDSLDTPTPTGRRRRQGGSQSQGGQATRRSQRVLAQQAQGGAGGGRGEEGREESNKLDRPYYTQKCLLGLVRGGLLDPRCPNLALHSTQPNNHCHRSS